MQIYYDKDADLESLNSKKIVVVGYGSQGHAHANNLKDSGMDVSVALRKDSTSWQKAEEAGFKVQEVKDLIIVELSLYFIFGHNKNSCWQFFKNFASLFLRGLILLLRHKLLDLRLHNLIAREFAGESEVERDESRENYKVLV